MEVSTRSNFRTLFGQVYYITPAQLFGSVEDGDSANTAKDSVGVLDRNGQMHTMRASGTRIFLPDIEGVGSIRQRYPVMPVHGEGGAVWKELETIKGTVLLSSIFSNISSFYT